MPRRRSPRSVGFKAMLPANSRSPRRCRSRPARLDGAARSGRRGPGRARDYRILTFEHRGPRSTSRTSASSCGACRPTSPPATATRRRRSGTTCGSASTTPNSVARGARKLVAVAQHSRVGPPRRLHRGSSCRRCADGGLAAAHPRASASTGATVWAWRSSSPTWTSWRRPSRRCGVVMTGNAQVNAPMIAVNDMMGFEWRDGGSGRGSSGQEAPVHDERPPRRCLIRMNMQNYVY